MEELNDKIARLLSSPESLAKIQSMMAALGGEGTGEAPQTTAAASPSPQEESRDTAGGGLPDLGMLQKLMPLMGAFDREDDDTRLLQALRPYLHGERAGRLDEATKLLKLARLLPLLQEQSLGGSKHG